MEIINAQIESLLEENDIIACLGNVSSCIKNYYVDCNWAGFYFVRNGELVLGPFQGKPACTHIPFDKGVCGKCYTTKLVQCIQDVTKFEGHIACDSDSRSELCVPIVVDDRCVMVLDLDSPKLNRWTDKEEAEMRSVAISIEDSYNKHDWKLSVNSYN